MMNIAISDAQMLRAAQMIRDQGGGAILDAALEGAESLCTLLPSLKQGGKVITLQREGTGREIVVEDALIQAIMAKMKGGGAGHHACGGACGKSDCDGTSCVVAQSITQGIVPMLIPEGSLPACYNCRPVDPCLSGMMKMARYNFDDHGWFALWTTDPSIVHFSKSVGAAPYAAAVPIGSGAKLLFAQEDAQQLPYLPGLFKANFRFTDGKDLSDNVTLRVFTGPRGLTALTSTSGLTKAGGDLKLSDFKCGDTCWLVPYPRLINCLSTGIPDTRAVYIEIETGALGAGNNLETLSVTLMKRHTKICERTCTEFNVEL